MVVCFRLTANSMGESVSPPARIPVSWLIEIIRERLGRLSTRRSVKDGGLLKALTDSHLLRRSMDWECLSSTRYRHSLLIHKADSLGRFLL